MAEQKGFPKPALRKQKRAMAKKGPRPVGNFFSRFKKKRPSNKTLAIIAFLVIAFFLLGYKFKGLIVVSTIDGRPIYGWQFLSRLVSRYGQATLEELTYEKLLEAEARRQGLSISEDEVRAEVDQIRQEFGGQTELETALKSQGLNYQVFEKGVRLQLMTEKLLEREVSITDREIEAFIRQNELQMQATDEASLRDEARESLNSQKMAEAYSLFFPKLKEKARIFQFLNF